MAAPERGRETERRRATVLFADLTGFTSLSERLDAEDAAATVNRCFELLEGVVTRHGGTVDKYIGDCVMALFGVTDALEDTAHRAVNAAIEMRSLFAEGGPLGGPDSPPLELHVGINSGLVIAGEVGGAVRREFTVMGDAVNIASRLKDLAPPGCIYVGAETHRDTSHQFEYRTLPPLRLKGKAQEVRAWELLSQREVVHRSRIDPRRPVFSRLVGRTRELARLDEALAALRAGRGGIVSLIGEAGLGKSRLVAELTAPGRLGDVTVLQGRSLSVGQNLAYHPFADLLRGWSRIADDEAGATAARKLEAAIAEVVPADAAETAPLIATLVGIPLSEEQRGRLAGIHGEAMQKLILRSVKELFTAVARRRPLVLVFEDLHWADLSSVGLLEALLGLTRNHPILFLTVSRPDFATALRLLAAARTGHADRHVEIVLKPLEPPHVRTLLDNLFERGDVPEAVRGLIQTKAGGNPFYLEEVVRALIDAGAMVHTHDGLHATEKIHDVAIPGTIRETIMARIDRLGERCKGVFQIAAVVGRSFDRELLADLVPSPEHLDEDIGQLVDLELLIHDRVYTFKHALIQEVAYESILRARREQLHGRVAELIEARRSAAAGVTGMLAYHFSLAGQLERAEHYLFAAGDEAARSAASDEALHYFRSACELYLTLHGTNADPRRLALLHKNIGLALFNRGRLIEAGEHLNQALECLGESIPRGRGALLARFARSAVVVAQRTYLPWWPGRALPATPEQREVIDIMFHRAQAQTTADPTRFLFDSMETLRVLGSVAPGTVPNAGGMYAGVVGIFSYGGLSFRIGRRFLQHARPLVDPANVRERLLFAFMSYLHHLLEGDWDESHAIPDDLLDAGLRLGEIWNVTNYLGLETEKRVYQGRFDEARAGTARIARIEDAYGYDFARSYREAMTAFALLEERDLPRALEAAETYYAGHQDRLLNTYALGALAKTRVLMGDLAGAREALEKAEGIVERSGHVPPFHLSAYLRSRLLLEVAAFESGEPGVAPRRLLRTAARAVRVASRVAWRRPEVWRLAGTARWLTGDRKRALAWWSRSIAEAERLGLRPALGRTCLEVGRRLREWGGRPPRDAPRPEDLFRRAHDVFEELGLAAEMAELARATCSAASPATGGAPSPPDAA
jgi:class 3 adenylate cyclase/tetratricopeptide (TPR) repeat protein